MPVAQPPPLAGVRVIAVEQYGAGPFGTQYLADMGAEVIKIENPRDGGDVSRTVGPYFAESVEPSTASYFFQGLNGGKKSVTLDLSRPEGLRVLRLLVADADALACNLRGDVPEKLGLTYPQLRDVAPRLVCAHLTAYGRDGARRAWPGYDYMAQAEAGWFSVNGEPEAAPSRFGLSVVDFMAGQSLALAITSGVLRARATGQGGDVDVSLYDTALYNLNYLATWYLNAGHVQGRTRRSAHPSLTPCQLFTTADGWIYVMCNKEKFFEVLCQRLDRRDLLADERFTNFSRRLEHREELSDLLDEAFRRRTTSEWMTIFDGSVPAAPILDIAEALNSDLAQTRIERLPHGDGELRRLAPSIRWAEHARTALPSPRLGEHTSEILLQAGLSPAEVEELAASGVT